MYIMIDDIKGEKRTDLSYPIHSTARWGEASKEITVMSILSNNIQYEMTEPLKIKL